MNFLLRQRQPGSKNFYSFLSPFSLCCNVVVLVLVCVSFFLSGYIRIGTFLTPRVQIGPLSSVLSVRADWPRSPLAHGCRSTHNSPVHSACSAQRLSQNFSVSVPTLIFTGTQRQGRKLIQEKEKKFKIQRGVDGDVYIGGEK